MKHYFVINPVSGKADKIDVVNDLIVPAAEKLGIDYELYYTKSKKDGMDYVTAKAEEANGEPVRFYAVGGDGTLYDVVNAAYPFKNAEVAAVPKGSGNDWIRLFGGMDTFLDLESNIQGTPTKLDVIKVNDEIAINQASMGFDAEACSEQGKMKKLPGAIGHFTYTLAGFYCMITRVKHDFDVEIDGQKIPGPFIFAVGCNSRWYGSGIQVAKWALPDDGKLDFVVTRRTMNWLRMFIVMMFHWNMGGDFYKYPFVEYIRGDKMVVKAKKPSQINVDGECHAVDSMTMELDKGGITFVIPQKSTYFEDRKNGTINGDIDLGKKHGKFCKKFMTELDPYNILCNRKYR